MNKNTDTVILCGKKLQVAVVNAFGILRESQLSFLTKEYYKGNYSEIKNNENQVVGYSFNQFSMPVTVSTCGFIFSHESYSKGRDLIEDIKEYGKAIA